MDIDKLEMILSVVSEAGEGAYWLAVMLIFEGYLTSMLVAGTIIFLAILIKRSVMAAHAKDRRANAGKHRENLKQLLYAAGQPTEDYYYYKSVPALIRQLKSAQPERE